MADKKQEEYNEVMKFQSLQQETQAIHQQLQIIEQQTRELEQLKDSLEDFKTAKKDSEMFSSLGPGIFVNAELKETENVYITVGSGVMVPKTIKEAQEIINKQIQDLGEVTKQLQDNAQTNIKEIYSLRDKLKK